MTDKRNHPATTDWRVAFPSDTACARLGIPADSVFLIRPTGDSLPLLLAPTPRPDAAD